MQQPVLLPMYIYIRTRSYEVYAIVNGVDRMILSIFATGK